LQTDFPELPAAGVLMYDIMHQQMTGHQDAGNVHLTCMMQALEYVGCKDDSCNGFKNPWKGVPGS
jgi:hypothetical protein